MNTLRILLPFAVVTASASMASAGSDPSAAPPAVSALPTELVAQCTVSIDPPSKTFVRTVTIGVGDSTPFESVATWVQWPNRVDALDGEVAPPAPPSPPPSLPWTSSSDALRDRDLADSDVRIIVTARLKKANDEKIYYGEEYFAIQSDPTVWSNWKIVMKGIDRATHPNDPPVLAALAAEKALNAQKLLRQAKRDMTAATGDGSQPRFGPSTGIKFFFTQEQPGAPIRLNIENTMVVGPAHGIQPLRLWLWVIPDSSWTGCDSTMLPTISTAFYDYAPASGTIPVPYDIVESTFVANSMTVSANTDIRVLGVVQERQTNGQVNYRLHYSTASIHVPSNPSGSAPVIQVVEFCPNPRTQGPPP